MQQIKETLLYFMKQIPIVLLSHIRRLLKKDKRLGTIQSKRQYDLPLDKSAGTNFLILLIALMTFLIVMALAGSLAMQTLTNKWSSGLENKATIEIPAEKSDGSLRTNSQIKDFTAQTARMLKDSNDIADFNILSDKDIAELVSPWLGNDMVLDEIPLPQLISVEFKKATPDAIDRLTQSLAIINDNIRLDTHEGWLIQLLRMINTFQFAGAFIVAVIAITTITAIAGGTRSRMAIHRADIELLHLMGASDEYITRQFQRHALILAAKGSAIGTVAALITLIVISAVQISSLSSGTINEYINLAKIAILLFTPLAACLVAVSTARITVLRELGQMP